MQELKTKQGVDKLDLMVAMLNVLECEDETVGIKIEELKAWVGEKIGREMTLLESLDMIKGLLTYIKSDPGANERMEAIDYLVELKFLKP